MDKHRQKKDDFERLIVRSVRLWASIEDYMAITLNACINNGHMGLRIFHSMESTRARFTVTDVAFNSLCSGHERASEIGEAWAWGFKRIQKCTKIRNEIVHGTIASFKTASGKLVWRLTAPLTDPDALVPAFKNRQLPGKSAEDLQQIIDKFERISEYALMATELPKAIHAGDDEALQKTLRQLERHRPSVVCRRGGDQTPQGH